MSGQGKIGPGIAADFPPVALTAEVALIVTKRGFGDGVKSGGGLVRVDDREGDLVHVPIIRERSDIGVPRLRISPPRFASSTRSRS